MSEPFTGRVALVTGGSRGIGRAVALGFARAGAMGIVVAARNPTGLAAISAEIAALGCEVLVVPADVSSRADVDRLVAEALRRYGRIDILVNNAGLAGSKTPIAEMSDDDWQTTIAANLHSAFYCSRAVLPGMVERRWGRIVNIASRAGVAGHTLGRRPGLAADAAYVTAKAAVIALTKALAYELAPYGVTANVVAPGPIATEMLLGQLTAPQREERAALVPVGRLGTPEEVAAAVLYLASESAAFTTGALLNVNGGTWMS
ncbi:MAG: 3-oxoacyl-ACP reductase FabG [Chloroflexi bacterium]|nr:3-oxoacyl-ACP reductase FabG [Chloroflexota bacterium]